MTKKTKNPLPTSFSCMGTEWNVVRMPGLITLSNCMGQTRHVESEIYIDASLEGDQLYHTYYHELMHVLCNALGRQDLNNDEAFIDLMAGLLYQIDKTSQY